MFDVAVIGAGVIGTCVARELSRYNFKIALIEKDNDVANGTTKANSAIVHAGYDAEPGTLKSKFNKLGNPMFDKLCSDLDVPFKRIGSLVIACNEEEMDHVRELYRRGIENNIPHMKILNKDEVREKEPNIDEKVIGALYAGTAGIVGPFELAIALAENAVENDVELMLNSEVKNIEKKHDCFYIYVGERVVKSKYIINCSGVYSDKIYNMVCDSELNITPRKGQYFVLDKGTGNLINSVIFQCPSKVGKGVLVTQTVHGNLLVGPDAQNIEDKENNETASDRLSFVRESSKKTSNKIPFNKVITSFAGLRAVSSTGDFIIGESEKVKNFINAAGIESPGLTAAPAIARYICEIIGDLEGGLQEKDNFIEKRKPVIRFMELDENEKNEIIKRDSKYGRIICRCENITEGEIVDCINRKVGARTVDGVKRRVRPGMGRCQGGFCGPRVVEILARELGVKENEIVKDSKKSYMLLEETKGNIDYGDQIVNVSKGEAAAGVHNI